MTELWFVASHAGTFFIGFIAGMWALQWAGKKRAWHEDATGEQAREYERDFPQ